MTRAASAAAPREEHEGKKKKSSFVTECFIFQKTGFRCASETLLLGIFFFHQAAYLSALVLDIILRAYLPSDQNFFPICFFIKIIRAWNQLLFFYYSQSLLFSSRASSTFPCLFWDFLLIYLLICLQQVHVLRTEKQETAGERELIIHLKIKEIKEMCF